jgi:hypothetical protein
MGFTKRNARPVAGPGLLLAELSMSESEGGIFHVRAMHLVLVDEWARASRTHGRAA